VGRKRDGKQGASQCEAGFAGAAARKLIRIAALPLDWTEQRSMLGFC
jgi:hypothetical protein